jgi:hypothetical protein
MLWHFLPAGHNHTVPLWMTDAKEKRVVAGAMGIMFVTIILSINV